MAEDGVAGVVGDHDRAGRRYLEGLVVRAVLLGLLRHQAHVGDVAHGGPVELAVGLAVGDDGLVGAGVAPVGDHALDVLKGVVLVPHLASVPGERNHC